eukprot:scaffold37692_cov60-Cyclotella_meneghiniana.AAC.1
MHASLVSSVLAPVALCFQFTSLPSNSHSHRLIEPVYAAPKRLEENVEGLLYVNDRCTNCAACSNFAPSVFKRNDSIQKHVVAALAACPVAAIRIERNVDKKQNGLKSSLTVGKEAPFPRPIHNTSDLGVYYLGHHNDASFGATPYLIIGKSPDGCNITVMVDVPRFSASAVKSLAPRGPDYIFLTHVDDTADHNSWVNEFPSLKRIFHSGDLGRHNWLGDTTLNSVEILLKDKSTEGGLLAWDIEGNQLKLRHEELLQVSIDEEQFLILHTPGHSPGSISLYFRPKLCERGVLFTGDSYAWTTRDGGHMSGFPRYGNNLKEQVKTLGTIGSLVDIWNVIAPGHGHPRFYGNESNEKKLLELSDAIEELNSHC